MAIFDEPQARITYARFLSFMDDILTNLVAETCLDKNAIWSFRIIYSEKSYDLIAQLFQL